jgi:peptidyl-tRNA hydrolase, PTH1 family
MSGLSLKLIAGLGNPGAAYSRSRHNAGFWFVDELAHRHAGRFRDEPRHQGELARVRIGANDVWLLKPTTFMNSSGVSVQSVANFYKISTGEILVAYDELDFPPGAARLKEGGGAAGHNGASHVIACLGEGFWRLRIGIGKPPLRGIEHVLARPSAEEERLIRSTLTAAADAIPILLEQGPQKAMSQLHTTCP